MNYQEAHKTYPELFKKYPEAGNAWTASEDEKPISYTVKHYEKRGSRWIETASDTRAVNFITYYNVVDPRASRFMKACGGYERTTCTYTSAGYIPTECVSISPDRTKKTVRTFNF